MFARVSLYEALLVLHVFSAFVFVAAYTTATAVLVVGRRITSSAAAFALLRLTRVADVLAWVGATGTLVLGVWLAIDAENYRVWDGWIVGAFVLWLVAEEAIRREDLFFRLVRRRAVSPAHPRAAYTYREPRQVFRSRKALGLHSVGSAALLGLLVLMIFKPGAA